MNIETGLQAHCSYLSDGALADCVRRCSNNPGYRAGIFVTNDKEKEQIEQEFITGVFRKFITGVFQFFNNETHEAIINRHKPSYILFNNSSHILIDEVRPATRGYRFNGILVDEKISDETIGTILYPYLIDYDPLCMGNYRQRQIQQEADMIIASKKCCRTTTFCEQNDGFINNNFFDTEENDELDEFINSFKINKNT